MKRLAITVAALATFPGTGLGQESELPTDSDPMACVHQLRAAIRPFPPDR